MCNSYSPFGKIVFNSDLLSSSRSSLNTLIKITVIFVIDVVCRQEFRIGLSLVT